MRDADDRIVHLLRNEIKDMFRLLGLRIIDDCAACAHKILKAGQLYLFCQDYEVCDGNNYTLDIVRKVSNTSSFLYDVQSLIKGEDGAEKKKDVHISVNAIVGRNGDGKSSIIEIILRVLNNFACAFGYLVDQDSLQYNVSVSAILYYEVDGHVYAISCPQSEGFDSDANKCAVSLYKDGILGTPEFDDVPPFEMRKKWLKDNHVDELFYTMVINYSIYSYNSRLFGQENKGNYSWIDALFHKNDSYQTPVVLNPMRTDGNIDINREEMLAHQRLMSLYTNAGDNIGERMINEDKKAVGFAFTLESESKLLTHTIGEFFGKNYNADVPWVEFERVYRVASTGETSYDKDALTNICNHFLDFWESVAPILNPESQYYKILAQLNEHGSWERRERKSSELHDYIEEMCRWMEATGNPRFQAPIKSQLQWFLVSKLEWINYTQFYRLILLHVTWTALQELCPEIDCSFDEAIVRRKEPKYAAKLYVCYKVIEILSTYSPYSKRGYIEEVNYNLLCNPISKNPSFNRLKDDICLILATDDYTTLKLRQSLNFIRYQDDEFYAAQDDVVADLQCKYLQFSELKQQIVRMPAYRGARSLVQLLPPPIFKGFIVIQSSDEQRFFLNSLSSGELQMINTSSSLLYHLRNLDDKVSGDLKIQYRNILVVLEEIELYFHPEYQKKYVQYLRKQIERLNLQNIENINLIFVTHSPFILSDILKSNSLYLDKGEAVESEGESFAGNLYDLMHSSFFLKNNAMGDFAADYVTNLIKRKQEEKTVSEDEIGIIGDEILKSYLTS